MTMVQRLRCFACSLWTRERGVANKLGTVVLAWLCLAPCLAAQAQGVHYRHRGDMSPGAIGSWQLQRGGPLPGYFQPVEIRAPEGARVSLAIDGSFDDPQPTPLKVGLLISPVYRLRVTNIPFHEGMEVYPTIEVIDRTYPPPGQETRYPIPIELTLEELEFALDGLYVVRVIYLEHPDYALPHLDDPQGQTWFDAGVGNDPLQMADELGRPVAILRMGGRVPLGPVEVSDPGFLRTQAPWLRFHPRTMQQAPEIVPPPVEDAPAMKPAPVQRRNDLASGLLKVVRPASHPVEALVPEGR